MKISSCNNCGNNDICVILSVFHRACEESPTLPFAEIDGDEFVDRLLDFLAEDCMYYVPDHSLILNHESPNK